MLDQKCIYISEFKMASVAISNLLNVLPFLYYWTNPQQIWLEGCESDMERNCHIKSAYAPRLKMAAVAILNFEKLLPFLYYWTNPHQI